MVVFTESLQCIDVYSKHCKCCDGAPLSSKTQSFLRDLIKTQEATFLDLRNYLFSRQCSLLLMLQRPWEVAQRTLDFLHNLVRELEILKVLYLGERVLSMDCMRDFHSNDIFLC